jgi:uncharacterized SAM-binding protein YcdF (DUF218 family)
METETDFLAKKLWDFTKVSDRVRKADIILVFGSNDIRVAQRGIELFKANFAPLILFSSGVGRLTPEEWGRPEAEVFADVANKAGIPENKIIIENKASNTGENVKFSRNIIKDKDISPKKVIAVHLPFIEKRTQCLFRLHWPEVDVIVASPQLTYDSYPDDRISKDFMINMLVGEVQRLIEYPRRGFIQPVDIPGGVLKAYQQLVELRYDRQLLK